MIENMDDNPTIKEMRENYSYIKYLTKIYTQNKSWVLFLRFVSNIEIHERDIDYSANIFFIY